MLDHSLREDLLEPAGLHHLERGLSTCQLRVAVNVEHLVPVLSTPLQRINSNISLVNKFQSGASLYCTQKITRSYGRRVFGLAQRGQVFAFGAVQDQALVRPTHLQGGSGKVEQAADQ